MKHTIERLWVRPVSLGPMDEGESLDLVAEQGVFGDHKFGKKREVTMIFADDWAAAAAEISQEVDPAGRRANVLLSGGNGGALIGSRVRLGPTILDVIGEVAPCDLMETSAAPGMRDALKPECRGGVWAKVVEGGTVSTGDVLVVVE